MFRATHGVSELDMTSRAIITDTVHTAGSVIATTTATCQNHRRNKCSRKLTRIIASKDSFKEYCLGNGTAGRAGHLISCCSLCTNSSLVVLQNAQTHKEAKCNFCTHVHLQAVDDEDGLRDLRVNNTALRLLSQVAWSVHSPLVKLSAGLREGRTESTT